MQHLYLQKVNFGHQVKAIICGGKYGELFSEKIILLKKSKYIVFTFIKRIYFSFTFYNNLVYV